MRNQKVKEMLRKTSVKAGSLLLAAALVLGGGMYVYESQSQLIPELVTFVDSDGEVQIDADLVPLGTPQVTKKTSTKKTTKKIKMKKASKKTYKKNGKTKTSKKTAKQKTASAEKTVETLTVTGTTNEYKKGSKINKQVTTVKTTVTTTVTPLQESTQAAAAVASVSAGTAEIRQMAPKAGENILSAYEKLGFTVKINPAVSYSGLFDARTRTITMKRADATVYHELGHFVAFAAGNMDISSDFRAIFEREKASYTASNRGYILSSSSEYFAESFRNFIENPDELKQNRPSTYEAIVTAVSRITDAQVSRILSVYGSVWNA